MSTAIERAKFLKSIQREEFERNKESNSSGTFFREERKDGFTRGAGNCAPKEEKGKGMVRGEPGQKGKWGGKRSAPKRSVGCAGKSDIFVRTALKGRETQSS